MKKTKWMDLNDLQRFYIVSAILFNITKYNETISIKRLNRIIYLFQEYKIIPFITPFVIEKDNFKPIIDIMDYIFHLRFLELVEISNNTIINKIYAYKDVSGMFEEDEEEIDIIGEEENDHEYFFSEYLTIYIPEDVRVKLLKEPLNKLERIMARAPIEMTRFHDAFYKLNKKK